MLNTNQIQIDGDDNITLQNIQGSTITIHKGDDANAIMAKLNQLQETQLDALQQIIEKNTEHFSGLFKTLLKGVATQKNIVSNSTLIVDGDAHIGDKITYIIQPQAIFPPELTISLPKAEDLSKIIGRNRDLQEVRDLLQEKQKVVVVNGLGGIGKTTLAQAYLTRYGGDYAHILWLSQSEGDNFVRDLITAPGLTHNLGMNTNGKDTQMLFTEIVAKLKSITAEKPNLLVIDNANAFLSSHYDYLPKPPHWHILATSREKINRFETKDLGFLGEEDAVLLFRQHCQRMTDEDQIKAILRTVDYHTLTIEILAKTAQRHDTPLSTLQQAIERDLNAGVYVPHKGDKIEKVTSYLLSIFDLAALSLEEQVLLQHFAALPSEFVPYDLLKTLIPENEAGLAATLQDLSDKGWLLQKNDPEAYKMHLIIAEVVKRKIPLSVADLRDLIVNVANLLHIDQTKDNPVYKFPFIPYGKATLAVFPDAGEAEISRLQNELAIVFQTLGDYSGARDLLQKALCRNKANFGENHPNTAITYSNLATVLQDLGDYAGARSLLEKAMKVMEDHFGEDHPNTAQSYSNLATVLQVLSHYTRARKLLEKALLSDKANFGENHPSTARSYSNLALVLNDLGDYAGARLLLQKTMKVMENHFGKNHPNTAQSYSNLAATLKHLGDYITAKELLEKAVRIDEANFGNNHPKTAVRYSNLATVLQSLGNYASAKELLEKTILIDKENFGENHPTTAVTYSNLALLLQDIGDYANAKRLLEKAMLINEKNFSENHPTTTATYSNLSLVLQDVGDYAYAKMLLEKAIHGDEENFGEAHPTTAVRYSNLATVLYNLGDYEKAILLAVKAYRVYAEHLGQNHPNTKIIEGIVNGIAEKMLKNGWTTEQIKNLIGG